MYRTASAITPDGVRLAIYEWGDPSGPELLFAHGASQSALAWRRQMESPALARFRAVAWDLRGHGASDKPLDRAYYAEGSRWADEVLTVLDAAELRRPTVVAWSYAGTVLAEYLIRHGPGRIAAFDFVAAATRPGADLFGPVLRANAAGMTADDLAANIAATRAFVYGSFAHLPSRDELETIIAYNMVVPPRVRAAMAGRWFDADAAFAGLGIPVLVTHGAEDKVVTPEMGRATAERIPGARLSLYTGIGHSPFREAAERFDRELAALADEAARAA
jgi:pimeloyl-ACP methyl ester carboxylesterase